MSVAENLPWITLDQSTLTVTGTPPANTDFTISFKAKDLAGREVSTSILAKAFTDAFPVRNLDVVLKTEITIQLVITNVIKFPRDLFYDPEGSDITYSLFLFEEEPLIPPVMNFNSDSLELTIITQTPIETQLTLYASDNWQQKTPEKLTVLTKRKISLVLII